MQNDVQKYKYQKDTQMQSAQALKQKNQGNTGRYVNDQIDKGVQTKKQLEEKSEKKQKKSEVINFFRLYKYADKIDAVLIVVGLISSAVAGCGLPFFAVVSGQMIDSFNQTGSTLTDQASRAKNLFLIIGAGTFVAAWLSVVLWMKVGQRISVRCRKLFLKSLMRQNISFFQSLKEQQFTQKIQNCFLSFRQALGFKVGTFVFIAASLIAGGRNAISTGWLLSVIMVSTLPLLGISGVLYSFFVQLKRNKFLKFYQTAQTRSKSVINNLSTIKKLNGQRYEINIFERYVHLCKNKLIFYSSLVGLGAGWFALVQFGVYALAFWFGSHCVQGTHPCESKSQEDKYTPGKVIVIFFAFYVRLDSMQQILPTLRKVYAGMQSAYFIYEMIEGQIQNSQVSQTQDVPKSTSFYARIQFKNVTVYSKKDPEKKVLDNVSFTISQKSVAFSGRQVQKQAVLNLLMRLQDPAEGVIQIDGLDIKSLSTTQLRKNIGFIDSRSGFFEATLRQNLTNQNETQDQAIYNILKKFGIEETIQLYEQKLQTKVGYQGRRLDQPLKNRLLFTRAALKNPGIVLIKQLSLFGDQQQQLSSFQKLSELSSTTNFILYFGDHPSILKSIHRVICFSLGKVKNQSPISTPQITQQIGSNPTQQYTIESRQQKMNSVQKRNLHIVQHMMYFDQSPQSAQLMQEKVNLELYQNQTNKRLVKYTLQQCKSYIFGLFLSLLAGLLYPIFTIFLADVLLQTFKFKNQPIESTFIRQNIQRLVLAIVYIGVASFVINLLQNLVFSIVGWNIAQKIRNQAYDKIMHLPIQWFYSNPLNTPYKTHLALKQSPSCLSFLPVNFFPIIFKNIVSAVAGLVVAFVFEWRSALLGILVLPMMMISGFMLMTYFYQNDVQTVQKYKQSSSVFSQVILNIKQIHSQNMYSLVQKLYEDKIKLCIRLSIKRSMIVGFKFGLSQFLIFASFAIMFWFGSLFLRDNPQSVTVLNLFTSIFAVIWPGWTGGSNFFRMPDLKSVRTAAANLFAIMDSTDQRQIQLKQRSKLLKQGIQGNIEFRGIKLSYPEKRIEFSNISFHLKSREKLALFVVQGKGIRPLAELLLRFKSIEQGQILIDGQNLKDYEIGYLRTQIGYIDQDPIVFNGTLRQNIVYNYLQISQMAINDACREACLIQILEGQQKIQNTDVLSQPLQQEQRSQPRGFQTYFQGDNQSVSVSQRQRIAIARTLLRCPKIILVNDEVQNSSYFFDQKIQKSIMAASNNRTCIYSPHYQDFIYAADQCMLLGEPHIYHFKNSKDLGQNLAFLKEISKKLYLL